MGATVLSKLTDEQREHLTSDFLTKLGKRLKAKREKVNLSQVELATCLDLDASTISKYENGTRDMNASTLPLYSAYCKFPMYELFPKDESQLILDTFSAAITVVVERKKRQDELQNRKNLKQQDGNAKVLKAQVYDVNGTDVYEPVNKKVVTKSLREQYKDAERHTEFLPYNEMEFCKFMTTKDTTLFNSVLNAGQFLMQIEDAPHKDTLKGAVADYIIDEMIINEVAHKGSDEASRRAYGYYRNLYLKKLEGRDADNVAKIENLDDLSKCENEH